MISPGNSAVLEGGGVPGLGGKTMPTTYVQKGHYNYVTGTPPREVGSSLPPGKDLIGLSMRTSEYFVLKGSHHFLGNDLSEATPLTPPNHADRMRGGDRST